MTVLIVILIFLSFFYSCMCKHQMLLPEVNERCQGLTFGLKGLQHIKRNTWWDGTCGRALNDAQSDEQALLRIYFTFKRVTLSFERKDKYKWVPSELTVKRHNESCHMIHPKNRKWISVKGSADKWLSFSSNFLKKIRQLSGVLLKAKMKCWHTFGRARWWIV